VLEAAACIWSVDANMHDRPVQGPGVADELPRPSANHENSPQDCSLHSTNCSKLHPTASRRLRD
jgi:hypothetical protein